MGSGVLIIGALLIAQGPAASNLLFGKAPLGDTSSAALAVTDGRFGMSEAAVATPAFSFATEDHLIWDLGLPVRLTSGRIEADASSEYLISGSLDGTGWFDIWGVGKIPNDGLQVRDATGLDQTARFLRLRRLTGPTSSNSQVTELQFFSEVGGEPLWRFAIAGLVFCGLLWLFIEGRRIGERKRHLDT